MSIIILGGHGFIGSSLRLFLDAQGIKYVAPTHNEVDLRSGDAWRNVQKIMNDGDSIVMIAAYTSEHGKAHQLTDWNIRMAANVIDGIDGKDIAHCVYVSSDSVYGKGDAPPFFNTITEETPIAPDSLYGFMHATREQMFREQFPNLTILRPCAVYGIGDTHNAYGINQFIREAHNNGTITLFGNGEECRPNIRVEDVAAIIAKAINDKIAGTFNVNSGISMSFRDIAVFIQQNIGKDVVIRTKPRTMDVTQRYFNNSLLINSFFAPRRTEEGIKQYLACMKD